MQHNNKRSLAGVWLDNEKALIISNTGEDENNYSIQHKIKAIESHGSGSEHTMNNAKQSDSLRYFKTVAGQLLSYDKIFIFGPGKAQEQFQNHLQDDAKFKSKQITIDSAEHLTDPQVLAKVRDHFN